MMPLRACATALSGVVLLARNVMDVALAHLPALIRGGRKERRCGGCGIAEWGGVGVAVWIGLVGAGFFVRVGVCGDSRGWGRRGGGEG